MANTLFGRQRELVCVDQVVTRLEDGTGSSVWIAGEPGIGKSALLTYLLEQARRIPGATLLHAAAKEPLRVFPLWVILEAVRREKGSAHPDLDRISALLRGDAGGSQLAGNHVSAAGEQLLALVDRLCAAGPTVLVVDDMQWADEMTMSLWTRLHMVVHQQPLLLVAACRPVQHRPDVESLRRSIADPDLVVVEPGPVTGEALEEMVADLAGAAPQHRLMALADQAGGNPFYVRELIDAALREDVVAVIDGRAELVSERVVPLTEGISHRLSFLSPPAVEALRLAAFLGRDVDVAQLEQFDLGPAGKLVGIIDEAIVMGVLADTGTRIVFRHELIQQALRDSLPAATRLGLHRQAVQVLTAAGAQIEQVAEHLMAIDNLAEGAAVGTLAAISGDLAFRAPAVAVELLERGIAVAAVGTPDYDTMQASLVEALRCLARLPEAIERGRHALAQTTDPEVFGQLAHSVGSVLMHMSEPDRTFAFIGEALARPGLPARWHARLLALEALALGMHGQYEEATAKALPAYRAAERSADVLAIVCALQARSLLAVRYRPDPQRNLDYIDEALRISRGNPDAVNVRLICLSNRVSALADLGRRAECDPAIGAALTSAEQVGNPAHLAHARIVAAEHCFLVGRWDEAHAELAAIPAEVMNRYRALGSYAAGLSAMLALCEGDHRSLRARRPADGSGEPASRYVDGYLAVAVAMVAEGDDEPQEALTRLVAVFRDEHGEISVAGLTETLYLWLPDLVRLALRCGDRATAQAAGRAATAHAGTALGPAPAAVALHCEGLLADDPALVCAAADGHRQDGLVMFHAQALENAAVIYAVRRDVSRARALHTEAVAAYTELGAGWNVRRADHRLRETGIRRGSAGTRRRPSRGWDALTPTEVKVARLVADGMSNPDVAAELYLSRRTVQTHVSHILSKLDMQSRMGIARLVAAQEQHVG